MRNTLTYRFCVLTFLLLFSFFHVGYAAVEYICSMGMDMDAPACTGCHSGNEPTSGKHTLSKSNPSLCCNVLITETKAVDSYVYNPVKVHYFIKFAVSPEIVNAEPGYEPVHTYLDHPPAVQPLFNLHGIDTSIQYTSSLR